MAIAVSVQRYLDGRGLSYDVVMHERTSRAVDTADVSAIPQDNLAKGVLMKRQDGYILAIVPASHQVDLDAVARFIRHPIGLATEEEVAALFADCEAGSIPPVGRAYGLDSVLDERLEGLNDVYFDGGDHCTLVHVNGRDFRRLTADVPHAPIATRNH
jgi:Ala-tRNA(Pro) deacylase